MTKNHRWTREEHEIIRQDYRHTDRSKDELAARFGVTRHAVSGQIQRMGIAKSHGRAWTAKEDEKLMRLLEEHCPQTAAKAMHRSINSIIVRSKRLGIRRRSRSGWFTEKDAAEILGKSAKWVSKRIAAGQIAATYHNGHHPSAKGLAMWHIDESDLKNFIRAYPQDLCGCNVDMIMLVDILAGIKDKSIERETCIR